MQQFFDTLFGGKSPEHYILIWKKGMDGSAWFLKTEDAVEYISKHNKQDIWFGVGASSTNNGPNNRCKPPFISGIPGVWLDLDTKHSCHGKDNLPETEEQIEQILSCMPLEPSIVLDTGHGRQYYWLFKEFWTFKDDEDRAKAALLAQQTNYLFRDHAKKLGYAIDSTFNLDRVLRIPGTSNCKVSDAVMPVKMLVCNDRRYNPDDIEKILPATNTMNPPVKSAIGAVQYEGFRLNPDASPPAEKLQCLEAADRRFKKTWEHNRPDLDKNDSSASSYDMALANYAFQAGWSTQEIVNLLIAFRRRHGLHPKTINDDPRKPLRYAYFRDTVEKLKQEKVQREAQENLNNFALNLGDIKAMGPEEQTATLRDNLTVLVGVPITRLVRYMSDPEEYYIETQFGDRVLGGIENIVNQRLFRNHLSTLTKRVMKVFPAAEWHGVTQAIITASEDRVSSKDATDMGRIEEWLRGYFQGNSPTYDINDALPPTCTPFFHSDRLYFYSSAFHDWRRNVHKDKTPHNKVTVMLEMFGFDNKTKGIRYRTKEDVSTTTSFSGWSAPITHPFVKLYVDIEKLRSIADQNKAARTARLRCAK